MLMKTEINFIGEEFKTIMKEFARLISKEKQREICGETEG